MEEKRIERRAQLLPSWFLGGFGVKVFGYRREKDAGKKIWGLTRLEESGYLSPSLGGELGGGKKDESEGEEIEKVSFSVSFLSFFPSLKAETRRLDSP